MTPNFCEREPEIIEAVRAGQWPEGPDAPLRIHAKSCPVCSEVVLVAQFLQQELDLAAAEVKLPAAGLVWWKAQLRAKRAAAEQATQPIALVEKIALAWGIFTLVGAAVWQWSLITGWLKRLENYWSHASSLGAWSQLTSSLVVLFIAISFLVMAFVLYLVRAED